MNMSEIMNSSGTFYLLAIWVLIIFSIYSFIRLFILNNKSGPKKNGALEILQKRYAMGEINDEQFRKMKDQISL